MATHRTYASLMAAILVVGFSQRVLAQANCALRAPERQIYAIFPDATSFRTLEAEVNEENRGALEKMIGSPLAPTDLGVHSAYIVLKGKVPIGFVHARSEIGSRGSIELVWAMDVDLTITEFRVQRSRERNTKTIESDSFRSAIVGRNLTGLRALLSNGNDEVDLSSLGIPADSAAIAHTAVLCALKTRVITEHVFGESIASAQLLSHVHREFSDVGKVSRVRTPLSSDVMSSIREELGRDPDQADFSTMDVIRVRGEAGDELGILIRTDWKAHPENPGCWWAVLSDGTLQSATIAGRSYAAVLREFQSLRGLKLDDIDDVNDIGSASKPSSRRLAREVLAIASVIGNPSQPSESGDSGVEAPSLK